MRRKWISLVIVVMLICSMAISGCGSNTNDISVKENQKSENESESKETEGLRLPLIEKDESMRAGQKVKWDCIWFGSFPQTEIVETNEYASLDKDLITDGDYEVNAEIYHALEEATEWDENGDITINGQKYRRLDKPDHATNGPEYYQWDDRYHYFRFDPVKWRVLDNKKGTALLLSDKTLDCVKYSEYTHSNEPMTWEISDIRNFLNKDFINTAFTEDEQSAILESNLKNPKNSFEGTNDGNPTIDKIFLLADQDVFTDSAVKHGFISVENSEHAISSIDDEGKSSKSSTYAKAKSIKSEPNRGGTCNWWLRTSGSQSFTNIFVGSWGNYNDTNYDLWNVGCRPALNLKTASSDLYSYAGTVCSDGTVEEK